MSRVVNLEKLYGLYEKHRIDSRPNFIYMTLPGSLLDQFAGPPRLSQSGIATR